MNMYVNESNEKVQGYLVEGPLSRCEIPKPEKLANVNDI